MIWAVQVLGTGPQCQGTTRRGTTACTSPWDSSHEEVLKWAVLSEAWFKATRPVHHLHGLTSLFPMHSSKFQIIRASKWSYSGKHKRNPCVASHSLTILSFHKYCEMPRDLQGRAYMRDGFPLQHGSWEKSCVLPTAFTPSVLKPQLLSLLQIWLGKPCQHLCINITIIVPPGSTSQES